MYKYLILGMQQDTKCQFLKFQQSWKGCSEVIVSMPLLPRMTISCTCCLIGGSHFSKINRREPTSLLLDDARS